MPDIIQFLSTNGDGTGTTNAIGSYTPGSPGIFFIKPPGVACYHMERMIVQIKDAGNLNSDAYGAAVSALTNGITVEHHDNSGLVKDWTAGVPVKTNAGWSRYCHDVVPITFGTGDNYVSVRWTFGKKGGPLVLDARQGDELRVVLKDDMSFLTEHYFNVQGEHVSTP